MEQRDYDELQRELAEAPAILTDEDLAEMERQYLAAASVDCSQSEFMEFDENTLLFFGLLMREVKRLRAKEQGAGDE